MTTPTRDKRPFGNAETAVQALPSPLHRTQRLLHHRPKNLSSPHRRRSVACRPAPRNRRQDMEHQRRRHQTAADHLQRLAAVSLADRQIAGRPIKAGAAPTTKGSWTANYSGLRCPHAGSDHPGRHPQLVGRTLTDKPTMRAATPTACCAPSSGSAVNDEVIDANPGRIRGAGRTTPAPTIRPAGITEIEALTAKMPHRLALAVTCASWLRHAAGRDPRAAAW